AEMKATMASVAEQAGFPFSEPGVGDLGGEETASKPERKRKDGPSSSPVEEEEPAPKREKSKKHVSFSGPVINQQDVEMGDNQTDTNGASYKLGAYRTETPTGPTQRVDHRAHTKFAERQHHHQQHNNPQRRPYNAGNVPSTPTGADPETDRRITFEFNALAVRAFMTNPVHDPSTPLTRALQLQHVIKILSYCEHLKVTASRYGSFAFWMGVYHLELDELERARECFDRCIKKDSWLMPDFRLRKMFGYEGIPQARRRHKFQVCVPELSILHLRFLLNEINFQPHMYPQYDAELFMFITLFRLTLRTLLPKFHQTHTTLYTFPDILTLLLHPPTSLFLLREGLHRLERNYLGTAPRHSEYLSTGECYRIIFATAELSIVTGEVTVGGAGELDVETGGKIGRISESVAEFRLRLEDAVEVVQSWSPRMVQKTKEFKMAEQCFLIVQSLNLVPPSITTLPPPALDNNNNTTDTDTPTTKWPTFTFHRTCGNRGCWRVFNFGRGDVRVVAAQSDTEKLRCDTFVTKEGEWKMPQLLEWDDAVGGVEGGFRSCEGCGLVRYCSEECRREDEGSHRNFCRMVRRRRVEVLERWGCGGGGEEMEVLV
ncbi:hypothetical protein HK097_000272, partial [Rhizophlyctis rosea]